MNTTFLAAVMALWLLVPAAEVRAQDRELEERQITLVGCVMRDYEYRDTYGPGLSGPRGPGIGLRDEYMLVDAREVGTRAADVSDAACPPASAVFPADLAVLVSDCVTNTCSSTRAKSGPALPT